MEIAKRFRSGNSNALRIPASVDLGDFKEFSITKHENSLIFTPIIKTKEEKWQELFDYLKTTHIENLEISKVKEQNRDFGNVFA